MNHSLMEALSSLRNFCLEATVWHHVKAELVPSLNPTLPTLTVSPIQSLRIPELIPPTPLVARANATCQDASRTHAA